MRRLKFYLHIPNARLNPNRDRGSKFLVREAKRKAKAEMREEIERVLADEKMEPPAWGKVRCVVSLFYTAQPWDEGNLYAALKAHIDELQASGVIKNDRDLHFGEMQRVKVKEMPRVEITIEPEPCSSST